MAEADRTVLDRAEQLLFMPDLMHYLLTAEARVEATIASTSQMIDSRTGEWSLEILKALELPTKILSPTIASGTDTDKVLITDAFPGTGQVCPLLLHSGEQGHQLIIGRSHVCHVQIDHGQISKMHVVFRRDSEGKFIIEECGSTNGSTVNQEKLEPGSPVGLRNLDAIGLGGAFQATFFTPDGMYNYLQLLKMEAELFEGF